MSFSFSPENNAQRRDDDYYSQQSALASQIGGFRFQGQNTPFFSMWMTQTCMVGNEILSKLCREFDPAQVLPFMQYIARALIKFMCQRAITRCQERGDKQIQMSACDAFAAEPDDFNITLPKIRLPVNSAIAEALEPARTCHLSSSQADEQYIVTLEQCVKEWIFNEFNLVSSRKIGFADPAGCVRRLAMTIRYISLLSYVLPNRLSVDQCGFINRAMIETALRLEADVWEFLTSPNSVNITFSTHSTSILSQPAPFSLAMPSSFFLRPTLQQPPEAKFSFASAQQRSIFDRPQTSIAGSSSSPSSSPPMNADDATLHALLELAESFQKQTVTGGAVSLSSSPPPAVTPITLDSSNVTFGSVTSAPGGVKFNGFGSSTHNPIQPSGSFSFGINHTPASLISTAPVPSISFGAFPDLRPSLTPWATTDLSVPRRTFRLDGPTNTACQPNFSWQNDSTASGSSASSPFTFGSVPPPSPFAVDYAMKMKFWESHQRAESRVVTVQTAQHPQTSETNQTEFEKLLARAASEKAAFYWNSPAYIPTPFSFGTFTSDAPKVVVPVKPTLTEASATETSLQRLLRDRQALPCCLIFLDTRERANAACISQSFRVAASDPVAWSHSQLSLGSYHQCSRIPARIRPLIRHVTIVSQLVYSQDGPWAARIPALMDPKPTLESLQSVFAGYDRLESIRSIYGSCPVILLPSSSNTKSIHYLACRSNPFFPVEQDWVVATEWWTNTRLRHMQHLVLSGYMVEMAPMLRYHTQLTTLELSPQDSDGGRVTTVRMPDFLCQTIKGLNSLTKLVLDGRHSWRMMTNPASFCPPSLTDLRWGNHADRGLLLTIPMLQEMAELPMLQRLSLVIAARQPSQVPDADSMIATLATFPKLTSLEIVLPLEVSISTAAFRPLFEKDDRWCVRGVRLASFAHGGFRNITPIYTRRVRTISLTTKTIAPVVSEEMATKDVSKDSPDLGFELQQLRHLTSLHCDFRSAPLLHEKIKQLSSLTHLSIHVMQIDHLSLWPAIRDLPNLQSLSVTATMGLGDPLQPDEIAAFTSLSQLPSLQRLLLEGSIFGECLRNGALAQLLSGAPRLHSLSLRAIGLSWTMSNIALAEQLVRASPRLLTLAIPYASAASAVLDSLASHFANFLPSIGSRCVLRTDHQYYSPDHSTSVDVGSPPIPDSSRLVGIELE